jgi:cystathionine beta-lyase
MYLLKKWGVPHFPCFIEMIRKEAKQEMIYDFDQIINRRSTHSAKWDRYAEDILPMWVADMDFISPQPVIEALTRRVEHGVFGYPDENEPLKLAILDWLADRFNWRINLEALVIIPGVVKGFNLASHAMRGPDGGGVLVQTPVYFPFLSAPKNAGMLIQEMELTLCTDGSYEIDFEAFEAGITDDTRLFILCNPHNPVGRVFSKDELERMAEICLRHGVTICSDEIHGDLVFSGHRHIPLASLDPEIAAHTITLMAPSKTFNLAGLECSFAVIENPELREKYLGATQGLVGWVNLMGQTAALAAYREGAEWLDQLLVYLEANRDYLYETVNTQLPGISMAKPEGTYLAWLNCREAGIEGSPQVFFQEQARVALNDGPPFGQGGEGFVRLNFGCPRPLLTEGLDRMKTALNSFHQASTSKIRDY